jgi:Sec-independent protein translocase protein TatA
MDLLGVGPLELIFVLLIIFLVLGPNDMAKTGKKVGRFLSTVRKSEFWRGVTQVTREMRDLPTTLMREAELEDVKKDLEQDARDLKGISQEFQVGELKQIEKEIQTSIDPRLDPKDTTAESEAEDKNPGGGNA